MLRARTEDAARLIGEMRIYETLAVAQLGDLEHPNQIEAPTIVVDDEGKLRFHPDWPVGMDFRHIAWTTGKVLPFFESLEAALLKATGVRTDWERRVLAAARWFNKGLAVDWPSDSLISYFVALEALFVPASLKSRKGQRLAHEVSERQSFPAWGRTPEGQRQWLERLYTERGSTAHRAGSFDDDLEVRQLSILTWECLIWAAAHLNPRQHWETREPCKTQAEALACQQRPRPQP